MTSEGQPPPGDTLKRAVMLTIFTLSWAASMLAWGIFETSGRSSPALRLIFGVNLPFHPVMAALVWSRRVPLFAVDLACLVFAAVLSATCMALKFYSPAWGAAIDLQPLYLWLPIIYVFAFTLPNHVVSLRLSLAMLLLFVAISLPYLVTHAASPELNVTLQVHLVSAVLVAALYFFASHVQRLQRAQITVEEAERLAHTDALTQLANRRRMNEILEQELVRFARYGHRFSLVLFDVDHFKAANDRFGHRGGDQLLVALAQRTRGLVRAVDTLGRWGGEEFIVVLPETGFEETVRKATGLGREVARQPFAVDGHGEHHLTVSCGVASAAPGDTVDSLLHRADVALYSAKRGGRNRVEPGGA